MQPVANLPLVTATGIHPTALYMPSTDPLGRESFDVAHGSMLRLASTTPGTDHVIDDSAVPVFQQGAIGSCVLNARCAAAQIVLALEGKPTEPLSRLFAYWLCSKQQGTYGQDTGTTISLACERTRAIGFCRESTWPYTDDAAKFFVPPVDAIDAVLQGADNRPTADLRIEEIDPVAKLDQMETAIRADHPVQVGAPVDASIQNYQAGQVLSRPMGTIIGGHSWLVIGVQYVNGVRRWVCRNSWGPDFGDRGRFLIDDSYAGWIHFGDLNVLTRLDPMMF